MEFEINMVFFVSPYLCAAIINAVSIVLGNRVCFTASVEPANGEMQAVTALHIPFQGRVPFHSQTQPLLSSQ